VRVRHRAGNRSQLTPRAECAQGPHAHTGCAKRRRLQDNRVSHRPHTTEPTKAPSQLFAALNLPEVTSNGEVEGPDADAQTEALSEGSWLLRVESGSRPSGGFLLRPLTVKLRGRTQTPNQSRGCILSYGTRGDTTDFHVPLQRLLEGLVFPSNEGT